MPRFTITTLLWLTALFATGMGTFGAANGFALATIVCVLQVLRWKSPACLGWMIVAGGIVVVIALLLPSIESAREAARRNQSMSQLKMLALSMHNYHDTHGSFPPAFTVNEDGERLQSWRMLLLPYLDEQRLYNATSMDEPWDSVSNTALLGRLQIGVYESPRRPAWGGLPDETHYFAVVDDEAVFRPGQGVTFGGITDGTSNTIVLIEAAGRGIRWHEPRDLTLEEAIDLLTGQSDETHEWVEPGFFVSTRYRGDGLAPRNVAFADGRVRAIGYVPSRELARALLTRGGGEEIPSEIDRWDGDRTVAVVGHTVHWRRVLSTAMFVGLAFAPFWWKQRPTDDETQTPHGGEA